MRYIRLERQTVILEGETGAGLVCIFTSNIKVGQSTLLICNIILCARE